MSPFLVPLSFDLRFCTIVGKTTAKALALAFYIWTKVRGAYAYWWHEYKLARYTCSRSFICRSCNDSTVVWFKHNKRMCVASKVTVNRQKRPDLTQSQVCRKYINAGPTRRLWQPAECRCWIGGMSQLARSARVALQRSISSTSMPTSESLRKTGNHETWDRRQWGTIQTNLLSGFGHQRIVRPLQL
jgi:hypothetical protein